MVLALGFAISVGGSLLLVFLATSTWMAVLYLSVIYMAISMINVCLLSFFPLQFAKEGAVASAAGVLDFATYLGTGISSMIFGTMIESFGYSSMFATWAVLCGIGFLLQRKK